MLILLVNLALAFYNTGTIWAMQTDIFPSWKFLDPKAFTAVRQAHWHKIPYWIFIPVGVAFCGAVTLIWYHPVGSPPWAIWGNLSTQLASHLLTAFMWGPWQARLANDPLYAQSPLLQRILNTHWIRTTLINASAAILLAWTILLI